MTVAYAQSLGFALILRRANTERADGRGLLFSVGAEVKACYQTPTASHPNFDTSIGRNQAGIMVITIIKVVQTFL